MVVEKIFGELQSARCPVLGDACATFVSVVLDAAPESFVCIGVLFTEVEAIDTQVQAAFLVQHKLDVWRESWGRRTKYVRGWNGQSLRIEETKFKVLV